LTFITGPVRSGKSRLAQKFARESSARGCRVTYVATATPGAGDEEWLERIERHRAERDRDWRVVETALFGAPTLIELAQRARGDDALIIDSTGTWLAARFDDLLEEQAPQEDFEALDAEAQAVVAALSLTPAVAIVVGDEIGWGIVPADRSSRLFRDVLGRMHQTLASAADRAFVTIAGCAIDLHAAGTPI
jgi:adenosylcobinamide kinase/adenosylcobinamide-phosphate guanylyltransferase